MAVTIYTNRGSDERGKMVVQGREIPLKEVYILKMCGEKLYIIYKEKPQEIVRCGKEELERVIGQLS